MVVLALDYEEGYGEWRNLSEVQEMENLNYEDQKKHVKKLWEEDPKKYYEWKQWCIKWDQLPNFFGTCNNPIDIDEFKL